MAMEVEKFVEEVQHEEQIEDQENYKGNKRAYISFSN